MRRPWLFGLIPVLILGPASVLLFTLIENYHASFSIRPGNEVATPIEEAPPVADEPEASPGETPPPEKTPPPAPTGIIKGIVLGKGGDVPMPEAAITIEYLNRPETGSPYPESHTLWSATTDAAGAFQVEALPTNNKETAFTVIASTQDGSALESVNLSETSPQADVVLELHAAGTIAGTVTDATGAPVPGAVVSPREFMEKRQVMFDHPENALWSCTDAEGHFELADLSTGHWTLHATADGFASRFTEAFATGESSVSIVLTAGGTVSGKVVSWKEGAPIQGVEVTVDSYGRMSDALLATTDAAGTFSLEHVAGGSHFLDINSEIWAVMGARPTFHVVEGEVPKHTTLVVAEAASISGTVTYVDTGAPLPGMQISTWSHGVMREAMSDASGTYVINGLNAGKHDLWRAPIAGERREERTVTLQIGEHLNHIDFKVPLGVVVAGRVVDTAASPVVGAEVECTSSAANGWPVRTKTGLDGTFLFANFAPEVDVTLDVSGRGDAARQVGPLSTGRMGILGLEIVLGGAAQVEGAIMNPDGKPMPQIYLRAQSPEDPNDHGVTTDAGGVFALHGIVARTYQLSAQSLSAGVLDLDPQEVTVSAGQRLSGLKLVVDHYPDFSISGKVTDSRQRPVAGESVIVGGATPGGDRGTYTRANGTYEMPGLVAGTYTVKVVVDNYERAVAESIEAGARNVDLVLDDLGTVEGQVLDGRTGEPVKSFQVADMGQLLDKDPYWQGQYLAFYDAEGRFSVTDLHPGPLTLLVQAPGYATALHQIPELRAGETQSGVLIRMQPGASLEGVVADTNGNPIAGAEIYIGTQVVAGWEGDSVFNAMSQADGHFKIDPAGPEVEFITVAKPGYAERTLPVSLQPGNVTTMVVVLDTGGILEGTVTINGHAAPKLPVGVYMAVERGPYESKTVGYSSPVYTDDAGHYRFSGLPDAPGEVGVKVLNGEETKSESHSFTARSGQIATVDFAIELGNARVVGLVTRDGVAVSEGDVDVIADSEEDSKRYRAPIAADGSFEVGDIVPGAYFVKVYASTAPGEASSIRRRTLELADGETARVDVELHTQGGLHGLVTQMEECEGVKVKALAGHHEIQIGDRESLDRLRDWNVGSALVDESGAYEITELEAGDYTIVAACHETVSNVPEQIAVGYVTIAEGEIVELNLALP